MFCVSNCYNSTLIIKSPVKYGICVCFANKGVCWQSDSKTGPLNENVNNKKYFIRGAVCPRHCSTNDIFIILIILRKNVAP